MDLTGKFYFKNTLFGLVLYVEYTYINSRSIGDYSEKKWRKASLSDITYLKLTSTL